MRQFKITQKGTVAVVIGSVLCVWVFFLSKEITVIDVLNKPLLKNGSSNSNTAIHREECGRICHARQELFHGNLFNRSDLVKIVEEARDKMIEKIKIDYGEDNFVKMFVNTADNEEEDKNGTTTLPYRPFQHIKDTTQSYQSLKRKLMIKILSVQYAQTQEDQNKFGCDCLNGNRHLLKKQNFRVSSNDHTDDDNLINVTKNETTAFARYVWATGGNSVAAGHGNLYNESYTSYLEMRAKDVFASVGIHLEGRNYARGSTESGPEDSLCFEETFGFDVDLWCWDYSITDLDRFYKLFFSFYRAGVSRGRPVVLARGINGFYKSRRMEILRQLESMGLPTFYEDDAMLQELEDGIPDMQGLSMKEIDSLPEFVRAFKCNGSIEHGDPLCGEEKYSKFICADRMRQASWHPGYKRHGMIGTAAALFLVQALVDAVNELALDDVDGIDFLLSKLEKEDIEQQHRFAGLDLPDIHNQLFPNAGDNFSSDFNVSTFYKSPSLCHTARLPSQTRFLGHLTDTSKIGGPSVMGEETYEVGILMEDAINQSANGTMRLVQHGMRNKRFPCREPCSEPLMQDFRDSFLAGDLDGWVKLIIPNDAERKVYGFEAMKGIIILMLKLCERDCGLEDMGDKHFKEGKWQMKVNDVIVKELVEFGSYQYEYGNAFGLKHDNGIYFAPNSDGKYDIQIRSLEPSGHVQVSSIVVY
jgi:hypothetical protein